MDEGARCSTSVRARCRVRRHVCDMCRTAQAVRRVWLPQDFWSGARAVCGNPAVPAPRTHAPSQRTCLAPPRLRASVPPRLRAWVVSALPPAVSPALTVSLLQKCSLPTSRRPPSSGCGAWSTSTTSSAPSTSASGSKPFSGDCE